VVKLRMVWHLLMLVAGLAVGCNHPEERFGRTWYLDGAGNWGFGVSETVNGLRKAGYKGQVSAFLWSMTMSPVADQVLKPLAGLGAARLAGNIDDYLNRYPNNDVNVIGLSAGAGVALRAVEHIKPPHKINNMILLAASISSAYDVERALKNMKGKIYVYFSHNDAMLSGPVRVLGTFGAKGDEPPAGLIGLRAPAAGDRVVNVGWTPRFEKYGWSGSHTSCTSEAFVEYVLSEHVVPELPERIRLAQADLKAAKLASATLPQDRTRRGAPPPSAAGSQQTVSGQTPPEKSRSVAGVVVSQPSRPVYAPSSDRELAKAVESPVVRPGQPATFVTLSRKDPRFPSRSQFGDGMTIRLMSVPGSADARVEVQTGKGVPPAVQTMKVRTGERHQTPSGQPYVVTLLRVDRPSQTAWLQVRTAAQPRHQSANGGKKKAPTT